MTVYARLRKEKGLTQQDVALALNVGRATVTKWETGENQPRIDTLIKLANLYGVTLDQLVNAQEKTPAAKDG